MKQLILATLLTLLYAGSAAAQDSRCVGITEAPDGAPVDGELCYCSPWDMADGSPYPLQTEPMTCTTSIDGAEVHSTLTEPQSLVCFPTPEFNGMHEVTHVCSNSKGGGEPNIALRDFRPSGGDTGPEPRPGAGGVPGRPVRVHRAVPSDDVGRRTDGD